MWSNMRKLIIEDAEIMKLAVQDEINRSEESRYDHRLHGILLACEGMTSYEIGDLFGQSPRTVQYWIKHFEKSGFSGLQEGERSGRPRKIDDEMMEHLNLDLRRSPMDFKYSQTLWDGKLLSYHLSKKYDIDLCVRQCQRLFTTLGFRRRKPRPLIAQADTEAQEVFKKTPTARRKR